MSEMAVIGSPEFTTGFQLIGIQKAFEANEASALETIRKAMTDQSIGILIVDDTITSKVHPEDKRKIEDSVRPVVVMLSKDETSQSLRQSIIRAIGVDLWKEGQ